MTESLSDIDARRLTALEREHAETKTSLVGIASGLADLKRELREMREGQAAAGKTNWGVLVGFGGLILTIVTLASSPFMRDINRLDGKVGRLDDTLREMSMNRWTSSDHDKFRDRMDERFDEAREHTVQQRLELDDQLQREMRLLDDALQREMRMLLDRPEAELAALKEQVEELEAELASRQQWMSDHDRTVSAINATQTTRLEAVEEQAEALLARFEAYIENGHPQMGRTEALVKELRLRIGALEAELARRSAAIEFVEKEQGRRRPLVYGDAP